jgi:hypothetical protein
MSTTTSLAELGRRELSEISLVGPTDPTYDEARAVHNGMIDRRPALIARCTSPDDVTRVIAYARRHYAPSPCAAAATTAPASASSTMAS